MATSLPFEPGDLAKVTNDTYVHMNVPKPQPKPFGNGFPQPGEYVLIVDTSFQGKSPSFEVWKVDYIHAGRIFNIIEPIKTIIRYLEKVEI